MNERLYSLIPLIYREKDFDQGQPLRALTGVLEKGYDTLNDDIEQLYDNWFIELCSERFIPQISSLVGIDDLDKEYLLKPERRYVANYLAYKRRMGLELTLNNALYDSTEFKFITRYAYDDMTSTWTTEDITHKMLTYSVDDANIPFSAASMTADFKSSNTRLLPHGALQSKNGRMNLDAVTMYAWRACSLPVTKAELTAIKNRASCYHINPFELDFKLSNNRQQLTEINEEYIELQPVTRIDYYRCVDVNDNEKSRKPVSFYCFNETLQRYDYLPYSKICLADLSGWQNVDCPDSLIAFDPDNGRVKVLEKKLYGKVFASYAYSSNTVFGAGPYYCNSDTPLENNIWVCGNISFEGSVQTVSDALSQWQNKAGTIIISDSLIYQEDIQIDLDGRQLKIIVDNNVLPLFLGNIILTNTSSDMALVDIEGLNINGNITVGDNVHLTLVNTTLMNQKCDSFQSEKNSSVNRKLTLKNCLVNSFCSLKNCQINVRDSVLLTAKSQRIEGLINLKATTVLGDLHCRKVGTIKDTIINGALKIHNTNEARFIHSYIGYFNVPIHCYSEQLIIGSQYEHKILHFNSSEIQNGDFCTLSQYTAKDILNGASNGEEMGVFNSFKFRLREKKLIERIDKFLPNGLDVQLVYMD